MVIMFEYSNIQFKTVSFITEGGRVELPRALTPQRFSRAVPSPIGLTFQDML